jgi:predicted transcriptional regulator
VGGSGRLHQEQCTRGDARPIGGSDPHHPMVGEEDIVKSVDQSQNKILQNLWFLCEKGYIEREGYIGGNAVYQITDRGRRYLE